MKLFNSLSLLAVGIGAVGIIACARAAAATTAAAARAAAPPRRARRPRPAPAGATPTTDTSTKTFAVNQLFLGETNRSNAPTKDAWKDYGYNIDGLTTTKESTDVCKRQGGADSAKQEDGNGGIDNAFGRTVLGFILGLVPTPSKTLNDSITGRQLHDPVRGQGPHGRPEADEHRPQRPPPRRRLVRRGQEARRSRRRDDWPYRANPIVPITGAYINNGTFVNGAGGATVELALFIQGVQLSLTINRASITFDHTAPNDITNGTISGVLGTEALVSGIEKVAGRISTQLCGGIDARHDQADDPPGERHPPGRHQRRRASTATASRSASASPASASATRRRSRRTRLPRPTPARQATAARTAAEPRLC